jgi:hypothetical protein
VTAITRHFTASVGTVRSRTEIFDVGPERVDAGKTQKQVIAREAEPTGTLQVFIILIML